MHLRIPSELAANCRKTPERAAWLDRLPDLLDTLQHEWSLTPDAALDGEEPTCSYLSPVLSADGTQAVLKLPMPHMEAEHEIHGLRFWSGEPTVRLLNADPGSGAMLLERCKPGTTLRLQDEPEQDVVISNLLHRLWRVPSPPHPFRPLSALTEYWSTQTLRDATHWSEPRLVQEGLRLFQELPGTATSEVLLVTDLHAGNVLCAGRQPWLVIDPKPFVGDPVYDATQHLFNCQSRLKSNPDKTIRRLADLLGVDHERLRLWTFARAAAEPRDDWTSAERLDLARALAP